MRLEKLLRQKSNGPSEKNILVDFLKILQEDLSHIALNTDGDKTRNDVNHSGWLRHNSDTGM